MLISATDKGRGKPTVILKILVHVVSGQFLYGTILMRCSLLLGALFDSTLLLLVGVR